MSNLLSSTVYTFTFVSELFFNVQFQHLFIHVIALYLSIKNWHVKALTGVHWLCVSVQTRNLPESSLTYIQDGFADFILEILAHEDIQQWIQATVKIGQAGG